MSKPLSTTAKSFSSNAPAFVPGGAGAVSNAASNASMSPAPVKKKSTLKFNPTVKEFTPGQVDVTKLDVFKETPAPVAETPVVLVKQPSPAAKKPLTLQTSAGGFAPKKAPVVAVPVHPEGKYDAKELQQIRDAVYGEPKDWETMMATYPELHPYHRQNKHRHNNKGDWGGGKGGFNNSPRSPGKGYKQQTGGRAARLQGISKYVPMENVKALEVTEKGYRRLKPEEIEADQKIARDILSILNKMTPEKFEVLILQCLEIAEQITTPQLLEEVVKMVFEKSLAEPNFAPTYAEFCKRLDKILPKFETAKEGETVDFRRLILDKCKDEFIANAMRQQRDRERAASVDADTAKAVAVAVAAASDGGAAAEGEEAVVVAAKEEEEGGDQEQSGEAEAKALSYKEKKRYLGTMVLIGELYARKLLSQKVMNKCMEDLTADASETDNLEALCKLLKTIGKIMDTTKNQKFLDSRFEHMKSLVGKDASVKLPSRLRFLIQDTLDLRANNWEERRAVEKQKKLSEIREDAEKLATREALQQARSKNRRDRASDMMRHPKRILQRKPASHDEWSTVSKTSRGRKGGPQDVRNQSGKNSNANTPQVPSKKLVLKTTSAFGGLLESDDEEEEAEKAALAAKAEADAKAEEEESESDGDDSEAKEGDRENANSQFRTMFKDYFNNYKPQTSLTEATETIMELGTTAFHTDIVVTAVQQMWDSNKLPFVDSITQLLVSFHEEKLLKTSHFEKGWREIILQAEDTLPDVPKLYDFISRALGMLIHKKCLSLNIVGCEAIVDIPSRSYTKFVALVLQRIAKLEEEETNDVKTVQEHITAFAQTSAGERCVEQLGGSTKTDAFFGGLGFTFGEPVAEEEH